MTAEEAATAGTMPAPERAPSANETNPTSLWWQRSDLRYVDGRLMLGTCDLADLAKKIGTPTYVLRGAKVVDQLQQLECALKSVGLEHSIYFAIKANRSPQLLTYLAGTGRCGADVCSPNELIHALSCGFPEESISFTGTSLSESDLACLAHFEKASINFDCLSSLEQFGALRPNRTVGLRINPEIGLSYSGNDMLKYSGIKPTKFGIYWDSFEEALQIARRQRLRVARLHFHVGCGYLNDDLSQLAQVLDACLPFAGALSDLEEINIGGGLGVPHRATDRPLDLTRWAKLLASAFGDSRIRLALEPGDFLVKEAGILLTSVTYRERRKSINFLGLNAGFNLAMEPAFYDLPCLPVATIPSSAELRRFTVVGNVNEALDKWAVDHPMPTPEIGDIVALINAGGYASSMRSDHCMRGNAQNVFLFD